MNEFISLCLIWCGILGFISSFFASISTRCGNCMEEYRPKLYLKHGLPLMFLCVISIVAGVSL